MTRKNEGRGERVDRPEVATGGGTAPGVAEADRDAVKAPGNWTTATETAGPAHSHSVVFTTLQNPRRRCVLHYLKRNGGVAQVGEMARTIAAWETDVTEAAVSSAERKRVYTSLYQVHLPNMDETGFLAYDREQGSVSLLPKAAQLDDHLEMLERTTTPWSGVYLGLSALFASVTVLSLLEVAPLSAVSSGVWSPLFATLFLVTSGIHVYRATTSSVWRGDRPAEMREKRGGDARNDD